jgi:hypothetical protein
MAANDKAVKLQACACRRQIVLPDLAAPHVKQNRFRIHHAGVIDKLRFDACGGVLREGRGSHRKNGT